MAFEDERYEALTLAMGMIDAALEVMDGLEDLDFIGPDLNEIRNALNAERIALLGNGSKRPWHVSDLGLETGNVS